MSICTKLQGSLLVLSNALLIIPLVLHGYFGLFSRYLADDFCTAGQFFTQGFLPSIQYWYMNWSGRFSFYFFIDLTHFIGPWITPYLTAATVIVWLVILYALARQSLRIIHVPNPVLQAALLAPIVLFATLAGTPDIYQSLYWQTGLVTYVVPLLFLTSYGVWFLGRVFREPQERPGWRVWVLSAGITFIAGGFSETYVSMQIAALLIFLIIMASFATGDTRRSGILILSSGLVGALAALFLVVTAPGNTVRLSFMPDRLSIPVLMFWSLRHAAAFSAKSFINAPISSLIPFLIPGLLALSLPKNQNGNAASSSPQRNKVILNLIGIPVIVYLLIVATITPSVFATAAYPAERALITAQFVLICALAFWSLLLGHFLRGYLGKLTAHPTLIWVVIVLLLMSGAIISSQKTRSRLPDAQTFASLWDERDQNIRQEISAGVQKISAASLPHMSPGLGELSKDPNDWVNLCLALSYGLTEVVAK